MTMINYYCGFSFVHFKHRNLRPAPTKILGWKTQVVCTVFISMLTIELLFTIIIYPLPSYEEPALFVLLGPKSSGQINMGSLQTGAMGCFKINPWCKELPVVNRKWRIAGHIFCEGLSTHMVVSVTSQLLCAPLCDKIYDECLHSMNFYTCFFTCVFHSLMGNLSWLFRGWHHLDNKQLLITTDWRETRRLDRLRNSLKNERN